MIVCAESLPSLKLQPADCIDWTERDNGSSQLEKRARMYQIEQQSCYVATLSDKEPVDTVVATENPHIEEIYYDQVTFFCFRFIITCYLF